MTAVSPIAKRTRRSLSDPPTAIENDVSPLKVAPQNANVLLPLTNTSPQRNAAGHDQIQAAKPPMPPEVDDRSRAGSTDSEASKENGFVPQAKVEQNKTTAFRPAKRRVSMGVQVKSEPAGDEEIGGSLTTTGQSGFKSRRWSLSTELGTIPPGYSDVGKKATKNSLIKTVIEEEPIDEDVKPKKNKGTSTTKRKSTAGIILNNLEDFGQEQLANGRATGEMKVHKLDKEEKETIKKALGETMVEAKVKGIDNECRGKGEEVGEYLVHRIMRADGEKFLVFWQNWNFASCTWQTIDDLEGSPVALREYVEKEKGLAAVMEELKKNQHKFPADIKFVRLHVPFMGKWITNDVLEQKMATAHFRQRMGYWKVKTIEIEWMKLLDPTGDFNHPPLYIEHWIWGKFVDLPRFKFITELVFTEEAKELVETRDAESCLLGCSCQSKILCEMCVPPSDDCLMCTITDDGRIEDPYADNMSTLGKARAVISCSKNCRCKPPERREIPRFPRKHPLLVFYDPIKGWSVRAITDIKKGELVSEYLGEVMTADEAHGKDESYNFAIGESLVVNAINCGNESRFFSHSCDPNMRVVRVYSRGVSEPDLFHRMVMVTLRDIKAGEELTFDYHPNSKTKMRGDPRDDHKPYKGYSACKCATPVCRLWL